MRPWIHVAYVPLYVLLLTAATACFIGLGEVRQRATAVFNVSASPARLIWDLFAVIASSMIFFLLLVGVGLFVGLGFGPFYLLLGVVAMIVFVLVPVMFIPPLSRRIETLTSRQIVVGAAIVVAAAFFASLLYVAVARSAGIAIRFADGMPM
jgi:hypothetical protein